MRKPLLNLNFLCITLLALVTWFLSHTSSSSADSEQRFITVLPIESPAGASTAEPNLNLGADGHLYLSWIQDLGECAHQLKYSQRRDGAWTSPGTVAAGDNWFVNWADFPTMSVGPDGQTLIASWLEKTGFGTYDYGVKLSMSNNGGAGWNTPFFVHTDSTASEHGFVSLVPLPAGGFAGVWLDGRETVDENPMTLRSAVVDAQGAVVEEHLIDPRVCDCCQTSLTRAADGSLIVVYRDRSDEEVRDISFSRFSGGSWSAPKSVYDDGWKIAGCPVNGPAIASGDSLVAVAWFTAGDHDSALVNVAFSPDFGRTFDAPIRVDAGDPVGRVDIAFFDATSVVVSWIENGEPDGQLMLRLVSRDGSSSAAVSAASISPERESGFAHLGVSRDEILVVWTWTGEEKRVSAATVRIEQAAD